MRRKTEEGEEASLEMIKGHFYGEVEDDGNEEGSTGDSEGEKGLVDF